MPAKTANGIHLTEEGYADFASYTAGLLGLGKTEPGPGHEPLRQAIRAKTSSSFTAGGPPITPTSSVSGSTSRAGMQKKFRSSIR